MISFWCKLLQFPHKVSYKLYFLMYNVQLNNPRYKFSFISSIEGILQETGSFYIWSSQIITSPRSLKLSIKRVLIDQFYQSWTASQNQSSKAEFYKIYKDKPHLDRYLIELPLNLRIWLTRFKTTNHRLPIETGRWSKIDRDNRLCKLCNISIGNEYHFLLVCPFLSHLRTKYFPNYFCKYPTIEKFIYLMTTSYKPLMLNISKYIKDGLCLM